MWGDWERELRDALIVLVVVVFVAGVAVTLGLSWLFHHLSVALGWR